MMMRSLESRFYRTTRRLDARVPRTADNVGRRLVWSLRQSCQTRFHQSTDMGTAGRNVVLVDLSPLAALAHAGSRGLRNRAHPQAGAGVAHGGYASARFQPNPEHDRLAFAMQKVNGLDATAHNAFELVPMPRCFCYISLSLSLSIFCQLSRPGPSPNRYRRRSTG
jgi:hypothetical protein